VPSIANITVKKNDGTTDIVWTGVQPSSGDGTAAVWQSLTVGSTIDTRPELRLSAKDGKGPNGITTRKVRATIGYPQVYTETTTSLQKTAFRSLMTVEWSLPKGMTTTDTNEAVAQAANLLASTLIKQCVQAGYSAT
jgi:hypothetical protein